MPRDIDGMLDDIDRLVDEQLAAGPVDDYNTNRYDKCWHCGRDWHGIPITERVEQMRWTRHFDESYRVADDDSRVLCPGSDFIGPVQALSAGGPGIRYWDADFNLVAGPQPPASPEEPSPPTSAPSREPSTPRARERHQLATRRQQQRDHIARTQRLVEQMHARIQELMQ